MDPRLLMLLNTEIKIFKKLKPRHIEEKHPNPFIYLCIHCNKHCEEVLNEIAEMSGLLENAIKENPLKASSSSITI